MKKQTLSKVNTFFMTLWTAGYWALLVALIYMFVTHQTDVKTGSICLAGIVGHTVMLAYAIFLTAEFAWPGKVFFEKYGPKGSASHTYYFVGFVIEILLLILEVALCIFLKVNGGIELKYLWVSPVVAVADILLCRLVGK